jgi:hypothetical protein
MAININDLQNTFPTLTGYYFKCDTANTQEFDHIIAAEVFAATKDEYTGRITTFLVVDQDTGDYYNILLLDELIQIDGFTLIHTNIIEGET